MVAPQGTPAPKPEKEKRDRPDPKGPSVDYDPDITPQEFIDMASRAKIQLIDQLAARVMELGKEYAHTAAEYYRQKLTGEKGEGFAGLAYHHKKLEIEYDAIKHALSALQSTLKAERPMF